MSSESSRCVPITTSTSPLADAGDDLRLLLRGQEPREHLDPDGIVREALAERLAVLVGEQRRRHEDRDLLAVLHRLERGADRDLGLAEADVAADQAVHRRVALHVGLHRVDRLELVGRLLVRERLLDLVLPRRVGRERVAGSREPPAVEHHELLGDLARRGADPAPSTSRSRRRPFGAASASRRRCTCGRCRPGRWARRACRCPCTRAAGSRARSRRSPG